ncbi:hypothetical protein ACFYW1_13605 [Streptomyces sp. NPDC002669]|uniref:hypothetical protein n=1 Tax=Streptomyces sp. NPDC002669 TaxID=3364658 RepID=UPI0036C5BD34
MEIIPGRGAGPVMIGDHRSRVEERIGPPRGPLDRTPFVYATTPPLVITYAADDTVELVEVGHSGEGARPRRATRGSG